MDTKEHFKAAHEFHRAASVARDGLASECDGEGYETMAEHHRTLSKLHANYSMHCKAMQDAMARKALEDELNKMQPLPTGVSRLAPTNPTLTAVPRFGSRPLEQTIEPEFADLVKIQTGDGD